MAVEAGLARNSIWRLLNGYEPKVQHLPDICAAVGLDFYVGPPRGDPAERPVLPLDTETHRWGNRRGKVVTPIDVPMREGHKPERVGFSPNGCANFGLEFLLDFDLDPRACEVIEIFDDSMAPEFPSGAAGLVDLHRTRRTDGHVYVMLAPELTVRRARRMGRKWVAAADNRDFEPAAWRNDFSIVGKVVWTSHMVNTAMRKRRSAG